MQAPVLILAAGGGTPDGLRIAFLGLMLGGAFIVFLGVRGMHTQKLNYKSKKLRGRAAVAAGAACAVAGLAIMGVTLWVALL